jgi:putative DNA primase/helicase
MAEGLNLIYRGDLEQIEHIQKLLAYFATGDVQEDLIAVAIGPGGNGKTLIWNTAANILGTYAHFMAAEALMETYAPRHPEELARLQGVRWAIASEIPEGTNWNAERLKMLSGRDQIPARDMYGKSFSFPPTQKLLIHGNHLPGLRTVDVAITGRMRIILHDVVIRGTPQDIKGLDKLLIPEWPSILRWIIEGVPKWLRDGLKPPYAVLKSTSDYFDAEDRLAAWLRFCCRVWPRLDEDMPTDKDGYAANWTLLAELKRSLDGWNHPGEDKVKGIKSEVLARKLREKGYRADHTRNGTVVWGLKIKGDDDA